MALKSLNEFNSATTNYIEAQQTHQAAEERENYL